MDLEKRVRVERGANGNAMVFIEKEGKIVAEAEFNKGRYVSGTLNALVYFKAEEMTLVKWPVFEESFFYASSARKLGADPAELKGYISQSLGSPKPI